MSVSSDLFDVALALHEEGDTEHSYEMLLEAIDLDEDGKTLYRVGMMYYEGDVLCKDDDKACLYLEKAYQKGVDIPWFMFIIIGGYRENGIGLIEKNIDLAIQYYQEAIDRGVLYGYSCLGKLYFEGKGVPLDYQKAYECFVASGETESQELFYLGQMYEHGLYVEQDVEKAREYYEKVLRMNLSFDDCSMRARECLKNMEE